VFTLTFEALPLPPCPQGDRVPPGGPAPRLLVLQEVPGDLAAYMAEPAKLDDGSWCWQTLEEQGGGRAADVASAWCWLQGEEEAARAVRAGGPFRHRPGPCATLCPVCLDAPCTCPR